MELIWMSSYKKRQPANKIDDFIKNNRDSIDSLTEQNGFSLDEAYFQEHFDFEESIRREGKDYKIEIDWEQFNELQVQLLLSILFEAIGYHCDNLHKADRAREDGADLVFKKGKKEIAIAVKVKPKTSDRQQLWDLSKRNEQRKIYVYTKTPSAKFRSYMDECKGSVEFWNKDKLNNFFIDKNLGFTSHLLFDSHELNHTILKAQNMLFGIHEICKKLKKQPFNALDAQSLKWLFRIKDDSVSLHKTNENVLALFRKPINIKRRDLDAHFIQLALEYMGILDSRLKSFLHFFNKFYERNEILVYNSIIENDGRSHWSHIFSYLSDNTSPALKEELDDLRKDIIIHKKVTKLSRLLNDNKEELYWKEQAKNNDVWNVLEQRIRKLMIFGEGIENIVDDIISEYSAHHESFIAH